MTINIALLTSEALVMGCDSIASTTSRMIDPFKIDWKRDEKGGFAVDENGKFLLSFSSDDIKPVVTDVIGGATKMFVLSEEPPVVAVTAGVAKLNEKTMSVLANEFRAKLKIRTKKLTAVDTIAKSFLKFVRKEYDEHYKDESILEILRDGPQFLIGGYGRTDSFPSLYRVIVAQNHIGCYFPCGQFGMAWNGQSESVERIIRGYDGTLKELIETSVDRIFEEHRTQMSEATLRILSAVLTKLKVELPDDVDTTLPTKVRTQLPWDDVKVAVDYGNMSSQNAVDFVAWLVMIQSGQNKFAVGLPTVGGRTHIGVVTKADGFRMIGEPQLAHVHTGFEHDL